MRHVLVALVLATALAAARPAASAEDAATLRAQGDAAFQDQDWERAASAYRALIEAVPGDGGVWYRLGYALHALGRLDEAVVVHEKAATYPRLASRALYNLACARSRQGQRDLALASLEKALAAGFRSPTLLREDADLAALAGDAAFDALEQRALPPAKRAICRAFDFWVGTWDVTTATGQPAGRNVITLEEKGMLLTERWTNTQGATGTSVNFHDPADGRWHQVWVDPTGEVTRYTGGLKDGAMRFEGVSTTADGQRALRTMEFTPRADGTVRQLIRSSVDEGATWTVYFDGTYVRAAE